MCETVEALHRQRKLQWDSKENKLPYVIQFYLLIYILFIHRCLAHVVNLENVDVMSHITKIAAVETTTAFWEYDPSLLDNCVLNGSLDIIATIRMLAIKVCLNFKLYILIQAFLQQIQASGQRIELFEKLQIECDIMVPLKIPLHSNV
jgi:hypothetical protein